MIERVQCEGGQVRLHLKGALDHVTSIELRDGFEALARSGSDDIVIDLSHVTFMDGCGLAALAFLYKRLHARGAQLAISGSTGQPLAVMRDHGVAELLGVHPVAMRQANAARGAWAWAR